MFDVSPLTGVFGAEISNLDLADGWDAELVSKIRESLRDHKVLVIRDQAGLSAQQLAAFATEFGSPETREHPTHGDFPGVPEVKVLRTDGDVWTTKRGDQVTFGDDGWHTDGSVRPDTNDWLSFLFAKQVPPYGRDTLFADMEAAYERLSPPLQQFLDGLSAVHALSTRAANEVGYEPIMHPVVFVSPETGRRGLYVNKGYTKEIVGLHQDESAALLEFLFEQTHRPQVQLRVVWKVGSLAIWDNRRTQHFAIMDCPGAREMYRVMVTPSC